MEGPAIAGLSDEDLVVRHSGFGNCAASNVSTDKFAIHTGVHSSEVEELLSHALIERVFRVSVRLTVVQMSVEELRSML